MVSFTGGLSSRAAAFSESCSQVSAHSLLHFLFKMRIFTCDLYVFKKNTQVSYRSLPMEHGQILVSIPKNVLFSS